MYVKRLHLKLSNSFFSYIYSAVYNDKKTTLYKAYTYYVTVNGQRYAPLCELMSRSI